MALGLGVGFGDGIDTGDGVGAATGAGDGGITRLQNGAGQELPWSAHHVTKRS